MIFRKGFGKIVGVSFSKAEQKAVNAELIRQATEFEDKFSADQEASVLWALHTEFGFGAQRLKRAHKAIREAGKQLREWYELADTEEGWICREKLKEIGYDMEVKTDG